MKTTPNLFVLSLLTGLAPHFASGAENLLGKFYVSSVYGRVECISGDQVFDLKKGDAVLARGSSLTSFAGGNATLVLSNETAIFVDEKTELTINKFEQQPFLPTKSMAVEPSNSDTLATVSAGRIVISTPQLLSGTSLIFETPHARISFLNGQPGGQKAFVEVTDRQTRFALVSGAAAFQERGADGAFASIGTRLSSGEQATAQTPPAPGAAAAGQPALPPDSPVVTVPGEAVVLTVTGNARSQSSASAAEVALTSGAKLHQGAVIITSDGADVYLQPFNGAVANIKANSKVVIEKLTIAIAGGVVQKQTALLNLKTGVLVSMLDPAKRKIDDYGVRTPKGIATAHGTSFSVSVTENNFSVAATADSVTFVTPAGATYVIEAGNVVITSPGGQAQPPIPLSRAVAEDPALARVIRTAVNTVSSIVQNNLGGLPSASAINLISQVVGVAAAAMPAQAANLAGEVVAAVNAPGAATAGNAASATASVTSAAVAAAPSQAAQVAAASTQTAPAQANTIAASAASAAPAQSAQIATAVLDTEKAANPGQPITSLTQAAASLAAAVAVTVPGQAGLVAGALMQSIAQANSQATPAAVAQAGATLAAAVTASVPSQAAAVASAVLQSITQSAPAQNPVVITQAAATIAAAVTSAAPAQAVSVATGLIQLVAQKNPVAAAGASGLIAATVSAASPASAEAVIIAVAQASNQSTAAVANSAQQASTQAAATVTATAPSVASGVQASDTASQSTTAVASSAPAAGADAVATTTNNGAPITGSPLSNVFSGLEGAPQTVTFNGPDTPNANGSPPTVGVNPVVPINPPDNVPAVSASVTPGT